MSDHEGEAIEDLLAHIIEAGGGAEILPDDDLEEDEDDDMYDPEGEYEYYLDEDEMDEEMSDMDGDDDFFDEDGEEGDVQFTVDPTTGMIEVESDGDGDDDDEDGDEDDDDDDGIGQGTLQELAALFNNAPNADARSSLLSRLLAGPGVRQAPGASQREAAALPRSAQLLRRLGMGQGMTAEERAIAVAERRRKERWWKPQFEPDPHGLELLQSGEFGPVRGWKGAGPKRKGGPRRSLVKDRHWSYTPTIAEVRSAWLMRS